MNSILASLFTAELQRQVTNELISYAIDMFLQMKKDSSVFQPQRSTPA